MSNTNARLLGKKLGNYTLTKVLGVGGFAEVYLGTHKHLETQAAIKVLQAELSLDDQEQFIAEARTVARLKHPHIIQILEFGIEDNIPFLVMNYTEHGTLRGYFRRGIPQAPGAILSYCKQIASALQYAHDQGIIHRDIKSGNMLLDKQDKVYLSDFGIATQARSTRSQEVEEITGTVIYMAPEQAQGKPRTASDQYSFAIVVYEWLTGKPPFQGDNYLAIAAQHLTKLPQPLRERVPELSPAIEQVVLTALAKDYHQRYACIQDFVQALEQAHLNGFYLNPQDFAARPPAPPSPSASVLAISPQSRLQNEGLTPKTSEIPDQYSNASTQAITSQIESPVSDRKSSISRRTLISSGLVVGALTAGGISWWLTTHSPVNQYNSSSTPLVSRFMAQAKLIHTYKHATQLASVAWSHDSKYVASVEGNSIIHVWNAVTGEDLWSLSNLSMTEIVQIAWSPDGRSLAVLGSEFDTNSNQTIGKVQIFDTSSHQQRAYSTLPGQHIAWSPDSKYLAIAGEGGSLGSFSALVSIWDGNTNHKPIYSGSTYDVVQAMAWKKDSKELVLGFVNPTGSISWAITWVLGNALDYMYNREITLKNVLGDSFATMSWSSAEKNLVASAASTAVEIWDVDTLGKKYHKNYNQYAHPAVWSPDGQYLASATTADKTIRVWNGEDLSIASTCTGNKDTITFLAWSPDGKYIASTAKDQTVRIWQVEN